MDALSGLFGLAVGFLVPAALVGAITAALVRSTRQNLPPPEATRKALKAFWIAFVITFAVELLLFGLCIAAFVSAY